MTMSDMFKCGGRRIYCIVRGYKSKDDVHVRDAFGTNTPNPCLLIPKSHSHKCSSTRGIFFGKPKPKLGADPASLAGVDEATTAESENIIDIM